MINLYESRSERASPNLKSAHAERGSFTMESRREKTIRAEPQIV